MNTALINEFLTILDEPTSTEVAPEKSRTSEGINIEELVNLVKTKKKKLWHKEPAAFNKYPSHSEADMALCLEIANTAREKGVEKEFAGDLIFAVFKKTCLYRPEKEKTLKNHTIIKVIEIVYESRPLKSNVDVMLTPENFMNDLVLTDDVVAKFSDAEFIVQDMIVRGHLTSIVAPGNAGKTTIFIYFCEQFVQKGFDVLYVNVDASPGDLKRHFQHAKKYGYKIIAPDAIQGKSATDVLKYLEKAKNSDMDMSKIIIILDTLKKFVDIIEKKALKSLLQTLRSLTVKGATIIMLGHTNKHPDKDKKLIFEGTGDLRNDVDEMIYLDSIKDLGGKSISITARPDKMRAPLKPKSFKISLPDREVEECDIVIKLLPYMDQKVAELAVLGIKNGYQSQKDLVEFINNHRNFDLSLKKIKESLQFIAKEGTYLISFNTGRAKDLRYELPKDPQHCSHQYDLVDSYSF